MKYNIVESITTAIVPFVVILTIIRDIRAAYKNYKEIPEEDKFLNKYFHKLEDAELLKKEGWVCRDDVNLGVYFGASGEHWLWVKKNPKFPSPDYIQNKSIEGFIKWLFTADEG